MHGISGILNIARNALLAQQVAMEVSSQNIANVNTIGYSRQRAIFEPLAVATSARIKLGLGVQIDSVIQYVDEFTNRTIQQKTSSLSEYEGKASVLPSIESVFNNSGGYGLSQLMDEFWKAWHDVAANPSGVPERAALIEKAQMLARQFNSVSAELKQLRKNMNLNIKASVDIVNRAIQGIAELNEKIVYSEASGTTANDLRDQRTTLLEKLSAEIGISCIEETNGAVKVFSSDGLLLVDNNKYYGLSLDGDEIYWNNVESDISRRISGGKIAAWLDFRDEIIPQYLANLDEIAGTFIKEINTIHTSGYTLSGETGKYFFADFLAPPNKPNSGDYTGAAEYIRLSDDVLENPENIAAGGVSGAPGDNENALRILALETDDTIQIKKWVYAERGTSVTSSIQTETIGEYYRTLCGEIGILINGNEQNLDFSRALIENLESIRESVSGVNLDEEMIELLKIQRAYEAAGKLISVADGMLETLMSIR